MADSIKEEPTYVEGKVFPRECTSSAMGIANVRNEWSLTAGMEVAQSNQVRTRLQPDFKLAHNDDRRGVFLDLKVTSYFTYKSSVWVTLPLGRHGGQCTNTRLQFSLFFSYKSYSAFTTLSTAIHHPSIYPSLPAIHQMSPKHPMPEWQKSKAPIKTIKGVCVTNRGRSPSGRKTVTIFS
jgi:hypothetical protein